MRLARYALVVAGCFALLGGMPVADSQQASGPAETPQRVQKATTSAVIEQPRAFGYVIGDVLTQRVLLSVDGREIEPTELPATGRASIWYERRTVRIEKDTAGARWLAVEYQLVNSPQAVTVAPLPAWKIVAKDTGEELPVPAWPVTIAPLTPENPSLQSAADELRPDATVAAVPTAPMKRGLVVGLVGLVLTVVAWLGWYAWRNRRAASTKPFARALRELRQLDDSAPEAWHALHRAFDSTAGIAVRTATLPSLFERAPHLNAMRTEIEQFFRLSAARFFAGQPLEHPALPVRAFCQRLREIEKRHEL